MTDRPDDRADVIEAAVRIIDRTLAEQGGYAPKHFARALSDAGLLDSGRRVSRERAQHLLDRAERAEAKVRAVQELHREILFGGEYAHSDTCAECRRSWPCPTIRALGDQP